MVLSIQKLLSEYFSVDELKGALYDIGEPVSGNKDELVSRLSRTWKEHNRSDYELLDFLDDDSLQMICYHYNLDATPANENTYIRRIKKAELLNVDSKRQKNKREDKLITKDEKPFRDLHVNIGTVKISKNSRIGIVVGIVGFIATMVGVILSG